LPSSDRTIFESGRIGRPADDKRAPSVYLRAVHTSLRRLASARLDPLTVDRALAALLTLAAEAQVWLGTTATPGRLVPALLSPAVTASVAVRRRFPASVGVGAAALMVLQLSVWGDAQVIAAGIAYFCALYGLTAWTPLRRFALGLAACVAMDAAVAAGGRVQGSGLFTVVTAVAMVLVRSVLGDRERRAELAERERDVAAREAVVEERARIARELHDAIAHNVSMMVVQAGAERRVLAEGNGSTKEALAAIEQIGRGALTEMRRLVGMLRSSNGDPLAPQPGLADLPTLVGQVREAGLPVELRVDGDRRDLPVGIELSAYRIVQEALTNALKHAGDAARASVLVRYGAESLELEIADDGAEAAVPAGSSGHGLVGMRERAALYGGRLDAGRLPGGGFAVRAMLPIR
jgi:signal transduction histidine kinase